MRDFKWSAFSKTEKQIEKENGFYHEFVIFRLVFRVLDSIFKQIHINYSKQQNFRKTENYFQIWKNQFKNEVIEKNHALTALNRCFEHV